MYEIVGFDEIIGGSYPPHSTQGLSVQDLVSGDLIAGNFGPLIAGLDPAEQLMAVAGLALSGADAPAALANAPMQALGQQSLKQAIANRMLQSFSPRTIDVQSRAARAPRRLVLNFRALAVQPGTPLDIPARPQVPFRPERLFVQSDIAGNFELVDIIVGNRSQFAQATPMSARIAAETSFGFDLHMDTAMVAMDVNLRIANITGAASDFRATIVGTSAIP